MGQAEAGDVTKVVAPSPSRPTLDKTYLEVVLADAERRGRRNLKDLLTRVGVFGGNIPLEGVGWAAAEDKPEVVAFVALMSEYGFGTEAKDFDFYDVISRYLLDTRFAGDRKEWNSTIRETNTPQGVDHATVLQQIYEIKRMDSDSKGSQEIFDGCVMASLAVGDVNGALGLIKEADAFTPSLAIRAKSRLGFQVLPKAKSFYPPELAAKLDAGLPPPPRV